MSFHSRPSPEQEENTIELKLTAITMVPATRTPSMMVHGLDLHNKKPPHLLPHKTHYTLMSFHSKPSPEQEENTIELKLTVTTMVPATRTPSMMVHGLVLHNKKPPHLLPHKTHYTQMSFHSKPSPEQEENTIELKLTAITMVPATRTPSMMVHGLVLHNKKPPHLLPHKTHYTPMSFLSKPSPEQEENTIEPKLTVTTMVPATRTPNTMVHGLVSHKEKLLQLLLLRTHCTPMSFHSRIFPDPELQDTIELKLTTTTMELTLIPNIKLEHGKSDETALLIKLFI